MNLLMVLLLAGPATRPLTEIELRAAHDKLQSCLLDPKQSFFTTALEPSPLWFVSADCGGEHSLELLKPAGDSVESIPLGRAALDAVAFNDLDGDGSAEIIAISGQELRVLSHQLEGYDHAKGIEARCARLLGNAPSIPAVRDLYRRPTGPKPKLPRGLELDCGEQPLPFAVSDDGRFGAWWGNGHVDVHDFDTGALPKWLNARLQQALDEHALPGCEETLHEGPHGTGLRCVEPVYELESLVAALQPPVHFVATGEALAKDSLGSPEVVTVNRPGKRAVEIALRSLECGPNEFPHVLGVLYGPKSARIVYEGEDSGDHPLYECTPEEQELERECFESGGTCIHDVLCVPAAQPPPYVRMLTVPLR